MKPISIKIQTQYPNYSGRSGLYIAADVDGSGKLALMGLACEIGLDAKAEDLHCTVIWSDVAIPPEHLQWDNARFTGVCIEVKHWKGHNDKIYVVAAIQSEDLIRRNAQYTEMGANQTFLPYAPHITLGKLLAIEPHHIRAINAINKRLSAKPLELALSVGWPEDVKTD